MCGLVSIIARKPFGFYAQDMDLFEQMLIIDQLRGKDSAGLMTTYRDGSQSLIKHATKHITLMFETAEYRKIRGQIISNGRFVTGHNRAATRGKQTSENAHPFNEGRISLVHNGTIWNQKELSPEKDTEVDSNSIAIALNTDTPEKVIPEINGAFALIWYNNEDEKLYAVRNDERPLCLITTDDAYYLMSEPWMMAMPYNRQNGRKKIEAVDEVKPGQLLSFDLQGKMESSEVSLRAKKDTQVQYGTAGTTRTVTSSGGPSAARCAVDAMEDEIPPFPRSPSQAGAPGSLHAIRQTLATAAKEKEERSKSCALTRSVESSEPTNTTKNDSKGNSQAGNPVDDVGRYNENQEALQRNIIVQNNDFKSGDFTLIKIHQTFLSGKFVKFNGKITMPGKPALDCVGVLPDGLQAIQWAEYHAVNCTGRVKFATYTTGGPSIYVEDIKKATYTDVHGEDVPWTIWNRALTNGCDRCAGNLFDWERPYTVVRTRLEVGPKGALNKLRCVCPDCLMKELPSGDIYDTYSKRYHEAKAKHIARCNAEGTSPRGRTSSVQDGQPVGKESSGKTNAIIVVPGTQTLQ